MNALLVAKGLAIDNRLSETSCALEAGQITCLIGPNGSGKTSFLHALAGIGNTQGTIRINGIDPSGLHPQHRQRLFTYLSATRDIKWPLTVADLIKLGLPADSPVEEVIVRLGLAEIMKRRVDRLSTGERSRVLIARALAPDPKLLLLDEPTANLDPLWQIKLMDYLRYLAHEKGKSIIVAIHDLESARLYADRLMIMNGGHVEADGAPHILLQGPKIPEIFGIEWHEGTWCPVG